MAGGSIGPLYGPLPELDDSWAIENPQDPGVVLYTKEQAREIIRESQGISGGFREIHKLSQAMNSVVEISDLIVEKIQDLATRWIALDAKVIQIRETVPDGEGLPIVKADVIDYSEEPLKRGITPAQMKTAPLEEEQARIAVKICQALSLELYDLPAAPCCSTTYRGGGSTILRRS